MNSTTLSSVFIHIQCNIHGNKLQLLQLHYLHCLFSVPLFANVSTRRSRLTILNSLISLLACTSTKASFTEREEQRERERERLRERQTERLSDKTLQTWRLLHFRRSHHIHRRHQHVPTFSMLVTFFHRLFSYPVAMKRNKSFATLHISATNW